jgi:hypothetical protein
MPQLDWTFLETINLLQVAIVIVALYVIARMLMRFWPWLRKVMELTAALAQLPDFIERTDLTLRGQDTAIKSIYHETHQNNGSSLKDAVGRVEKGVAGLHLKVAELTAADAAQAVIVEALREDLEETKPGQQANKSKE